MARSSRHGFFVQQEQKVRSVAMAWAPVTRAALLLMHSMAESRYGPCMRLPHCMGPARLLVLTYRHGLAGAAVALREQHAAAAFQGVPCAAHARSSSARPCCLP